ncbi:MAG TPA: DedA family protein [Alphaproteobacteria bacterium]|nr:DedA family protein [Alphaproteobacteria bacterium]
MHQIYDLIHHHGNFFYLITFVWTALEGETFVIFAGLAAQKHLINVWLLFLAAWLGSMAGDQIFFFIGRRFGTKILEHLPKLKPSVDHALVWLERYSILFILCYRFMYGLRNISGIAVGLSHVEWKKFAIWNAVAAFLWAAVFVGAGYLYGDVLAHMHHKEAVVEDSVRQITLSVLGLFVFLIVAKLGLMRWHRYRVHKKYGPKDEA